ncbi:MAG: translation initiation factor IF-6 [Candidatus Woesearchaeota archaeon]|nr:translation initiation factor IF-6 [Candidatus Woesearchaeota archaeon]
MHTLTTSFHNNPHIGLYMFVTNEYCLLGYNIKRRLKEQIEDVLKVPVYHQLIYGTPFAGIFCAGNSKKLLLPHIVYDDELKQIERLNIDYEIIKTRLTALGNNILCNNNGCMVNPDFEEDAKGKISKALGIKVHTGRIADLKTVGSLAVMNSAYCICHTNTTEKEIKRIKEIFKVECETGTVNMANPYLRSGVACNDHGVIIGDHSGGPEVVHIEQSLGYLEKQT